MDEVLIGMICLIAGAILGAIIVVGSANNSLKRDCDTMQQFRIGDAVYRCEKRP